MLNIEGDSKWMVSILSILFSLFILNYLVFLSLRVPVSGKRPYKISFLDWFLKDAVPMNGPITVVNQVFVYSLIGTHINENHYCVTIVWEILQIWMRPVLISLLSFEGTVLFITFLSQFSSGPHFWILIWQHL